MLCEVMLKTIIFALGRTHVRLKPHVGKSPVFGKSLIKGEKAPDWLDVIEATGWAEATLFRNQQLAKLLCRKKKTFSQLSKA